MTQFQRVVSVLALSLAACGKEATQEAEAPSSTPMDAAPATPSVGGLTTSDSAAPAVSDTAETAQPAAVASAPTPEPLTDEQVMMVSDLTNTAEIDQAKLAQGKAKDAKVKKFAALMLAHHSEAKQKQAKLASKLKVKPAESPLALQLTADSSSMLSTLKGTNAPDFDRAYIDSQVEAHTKVLDTLDTRLIPSAQNADLKALLQEFRPRVEAHLSEAKSLQQTLASTSSAASSTGSGTGTSSATTKANDGAKGASSTSTGSGAGSGSGTGSSAGSSGHKPHSSGAPGTKP